MEATTVRRRRTVEPITKVWNAARKLDDSMKLQLITMLAESLKPAVDREQAQSEVKSAVAEPHKPRLYDPETGEYLNDETMQVIEDVRSGKEPMYEMKSMEEFKAWCEAL